MLFGHQNDTKQPEPAAPAADSAAAATPAGGINPLAVDPATGASLPVAPAGRIEDDGPSILNQPVPAPAAPDAPATSLPSVAPALSFPAIPGPLTDLPATPTIDPSPPAVTSPSDTAPADLDDFTGTLPGESPSAGSFDASAPEMPASTPESTPAEPMPAAPERAADTVEADGPAAADPVTSQPATAPLAVTDDLLSLKQQALAELGPLVDQLDQSPVERFRTTMMMIQSTDNQSLIPRAYEAAQAITDEKARAQALLDIVNEINYFTQQKPAEQ